MSKVAIVAGATGIVGNSILEYFIQNTTNKEWSKIYATSRREPVLSAKDDRIVFIPLDLEGEQEKIEETLKNAGCSSVTHVSIEL